jgi:opacity protein-like surface antigen
MLIGAPKLLAKGTSMKLRSIALVLAAALVSAAAHAQSGVFISMDAQQFTQEGVLVNPGLHSNIDRPWLFGPIYGVYFDITRLPKLGALKTGPVVLGLDGRGDTLRYTESWLGGQSGPFYRQDGIISLRVAPKKELGGYTPYLLAGLGIGHTKVPLRTAYSNNFIYQFGAGVDRKIAKKIDWRVVEATIGGLKDYRTGYSPSGLGPNQSNYMFSLSTGVVFRLR